MKDECALRVHLNFETPECLIYAKQAIYETDVEAVLINIRYDVLAPVTETAVCVYNCLMALDSAWYISKRCVDLFFRGLFFKILRDRTIKHIVGHWNGQLDFTDLYHLKRLFTTMFIINSDTSRAKRPTKSTDRNFYCKVELFYYNYSFGYEKCLLFKLTLATLRTF